jgi:hypothetical protein
MCTWWFIVLCGFPYNRTTLSSLVAVDATKLILNVSGFLFSIFVLWWYTNICIYNNIQFGLISCNLRILATNKYQHTGMCSNQIKIKWLYLFLLLFMVIHNHLMTTVWGHVRVYICILFRLYKQLCINAQFYIFTVCCTVCKSDQNQISNLCPTLFTEKISVIKIR